MFFAIHLIVIAICVFFALAILLLIQQRFIKKLLDTLKKIETREKKRQNTLIAFVRESIQNYVDETDVWVDVRKDERVAINMFVKLPSQYMIIETRARSASSPDHGTLVQFGINFDNDMGDVYSMNLSNKVVHDFRLVHESLHEALLLARVHLIRLTSKSEGVI